ncbi:WhiB family transcriptional regulator [Microbacterium xylanilyticum]
MIAELPEFIGQPEHAALVRAMEDTPPACDGLEMFTHDRFFDPEQTEMMRGICHACPLLELCRTFAIAGKPTAGMWAGMTPAEIRHLGTQAAAA